MLKGEIKDFIRFREFFNRETYTYTFSRDVYNVNKKTIREKIKSHPEKYNFTCAYVDGTMVYLVSKKVSAFK